MALFRKKAAPPPAAPAHYLVAGGQIRSLADPENWLLELFGAGVSAIGLPTGRTAALKYSASAAANIAVNVLDKILSKLEDQLVDALFNVGSASSGLGGGGGGNFLGTLFSGFGKLFGFEGGGHTGPGAKNKPAGLVHADEFVFTKKATQRAGVGNLYRMMDYLETGNMKSLMGAGMPGFADGGYVGASNLPSMPSTAMQMSSAAPSVNDNSMQASKDSLQISLGWEKGSNGNIEPIIKEISRKSIAEAAPGLLGAAKQQVLPAISDHQRKRAGGDWRNGS